MKNEELGMRNGSSEDFLRSPFPVLRSPFFVPPVGFVLLIHDHPFVHWDLLVQHGEVLRSWRLLESPDRWRSAAESTELSAESIGDHRLLYLDYEGPVSRERGRVVRWDHGQAEWLVNGEAAVRLKLSGGRLIGVLVLKLTTLRPLWSARFFPTATGVLEPKSRS